jgi:hypothetical protein
MGRGWKGWVGEDIFQWQQRRRTKIDEERLRTTEKYQVLTPSCAAVIGKGSLQLVRPSISQILKFEVLSLVRIYLLFCNRLLKAYLHV